MQFLVLNKKRIGVVLFSLIISISVIGITKKNNTVETISWSVESKTIILDAGHGLPDERCL